MRRGCEGLDAQGIRSDFRTAFSPTRVRDVGRRFRRQTRRRWEVGTTKLVDHVGGHARNIIYTIGRGTEPPTGPTVIRLGFSGI